MEILEIYDQYGNTELRTSLMHITLLKQFYFLKQHIDRGVNYSLNWLPTVGEIVEEYERRNKQWKTGDIAKGIRN